MAVNHSILHVTGELQILLVQIIVLSDYCGDTGRETVLPRLMKQRAGTSQERALAGVGMKQVPAECLGLHLPRQTLSQHTALKSLMLSC